MALEKRGGKQGDEKVREVVVLGGRYFWEIPDEKHLEEVLEEKHLEGVLEERCLGEVLGGRQNAEKDVGRNEVRAVIARYVVYDEIKWMDSETVAVTTICDGSESSNS